MEEKLIIDCSESEIKKMYTRVGWDIINQLAEYLDDVEFPEKRKIYLDVRGVSESKESQPTGWLEYVDCEPKFRTNLVEGKPANMYFKDLANYEFMFKVKESILKAVDLWKQRKEAIDWVEQGKRCVYRSGWAWKGAGYRDITQEKAKALLPGYSFGKGFYELGWITIDGERVLEFNELSESDMW